MKIERLRAVVRDCCQINTSDSMKPHSFALLLAVFALSSGQPSFCQSDEQKFIELGNAGLKALSQEQNLEKAERLLNEALTHAGGREYDPRVAKVCSNLARVHLKSSQLVKAEPCAQKALEIFEKNYGENNYQSVLALLSLQSIYTGLNQPAKLSSVNDKLAAIYQKYKGEACKDPKILGQLILVSNQRAYQLFLDDKLEEAQKILDDNMKLVPEDAEAMSFKGLVMVKQGRGGEARSLFERAERLAPNQALPVYGQLVSYIKSGDLGKAKSKWIELKNRFPSSPFTRNADGQIEAINKEQANTTDGMDRNAPDYYESAVSKGIVFWKSSSLPIKVFVKSGDTTPDYRDFFKTALINAFKEWQSLSQKTLSFDFVDDQSRADILCSFTSEVSDLSNPSEGAEAKVFPRTDGSIGKATIVILTKKPGNQPPGDAVIMNTCRHEIGHAVGIIGHSNNPEDIMYFAQIDESVEKRISNRDISTLQKLYSNNQF